MRPRSLTRQRDTIAVGRMFVDPEAMQLQEIDRRLKFRRGRASRLLKEARRQGLLAVRSELPVPRDYDLGSKLGKRFAPTEVWVIETPELDSPESLPRLERQYEDDDLLHEMLGRAAAQYLADNLRNDDLLCVGAGRAVFHSGRALCRLNGHHKKKKGITVMGLHGRAVRRVWRTTSPYAKQSIDAVRVAHVFADALPMSRVWPVHSPLVQRDLEQVRHQLEPNGRAWFLSQSEWQRRPRSLALVGLGIMGAPELLGGSPRPAGQPWLRPSGTGPIAPELTELRRICRSFYERHLYVPVSDVCDRLFWVPGDEESSEFRRKAAPLIRSVNEHLLTVETGLPPCARSSHDGHHPRPGSLDQVQEVILVAGGPFKVRAIHSLLTRWRSGERRFVDTLITDVRTAQALLELDVRNRRSQQWN